jgi:peptidoglycan/LPS O-acetylase OafA/YrhL
MQGTLNSPNNSARGEADRMTKQPKLGRNASGGDSDFPEHHLPEKKRHSATLLLPRIAELDGWRTISVALVIFSHVLTKSSIALDQTRYGFLEGWGTFGVRIFFVISGFVICRGLLKEYYEYSTISIFAFYVRRIFRIIPMLFIYIFAVWTLSKFEIVEYDSSITYKLVLFICTLSDGGCGGYTTAHLWSLAVEEQFYAIFPVLFLFLTIYFKRVLGLIFLGLPICLLALAFFEQNVAFENLTTFVWINAGVVAAIFEKQLLLFTKKSSALFPIIIFILIIFGSNYLTPSRISTVILSCIMPYMIAIMLFMSINAKTCSSKLLVSWPMAIAGRASYGIYLWQQLATTPFQGVGVLFYMWTVPASILLPIFSFMYIEKPIIKFGSRLSDRILSKEDSSFRA